MAPDGARGDSWGPASGAVYPTGPAVLLNVASPLQEQLDWLLRENPDYLISFPSNLAALARYCIDRRLTLGNLKQVMTVGETVTAKRSEEHTSELQSLMRTSYAVLCLKKKKQI